MLTTLSILSRDQGKLTRKPLTEAEYYARFVSETPKPALEERQAWHFLGWEWGGYPTTSLK